MVETADERRAREEREAQEAAAAARTRADAQGTEGAVDAGAAETAAPAVVPVDLDAVNIAGIDSLRDMTVEEGTILYNHLPSLTNGSRYTQIADQVAELVGTYQSVSSIPLPEGMSPGAAIQGWLDMLQRGRDTLNAADRAFFDSLQPILGDTGAARDIANGLGAVQNVGSVLDGLGDGLLAAPSAVYNAPHNTGVMTGAAIDRHVSPEQAKAFGAAYAYALYLETDAPAARRREAPKTGFDAFLDGIGKTFEWIVGWGQLGIMHLTHSFPIVPAIMAAVGNSIKNLFENGRFEFDLAAAQQQVAQEQAEELQPFGGRIPNHAQLIEHNRNSQEVADETRARAADTLLAMHSVAGINTADFVPLVRDGGVIRDNDGNLSTVDPNTGSFAPTPMEADGKQLNITNEFRGTVERGRDGYYYTGAAVGVGLSVAATGYVGYKLAPTAGRAGLRVARAAVAADAGFRSGFLRGYAQSLAGNHLPFGKITSPLDPRLNAPLQELRTAHARRAYFLTRHEEITRQIARSELKHGRTTVFARMFLEPAAHSMSQKADLMSIKMGELETGRFQIRPRNFDIGRIFRHGFFGKEGFGSVVNHGAALDRRLVDTGIERTTDARGRTLLQRTGEEIVERARPQMPRVANAEDMGRALTRVSGVASQATDGARLATTLQRELRGLATTGVTQDAIQAAIRAQQTATETARGLATLANAGGDAAEIAARTQRLVAQQAEATARLAEIARATGAAEGSRLSRLVSESETLGRTATRVAESATDISRIAGAAVQEVRGTQRLVTAAGAHIDDLAAVITRTPEVLRTITPEMVPALEGRRAQFGEIGQFGAESLRAGALNSVTAETIGHIPETTMQALSRSPALDTIPHSAFANATNGQWRALVQGADGDAAALARIFTPERIAHVPVKFAGDIPASVINALTPAQIEQLPPRLAREMMIKHGSDITPEMRESLRTRNNYETHRATDADRAAQASEDVRAAGDRRVQGLSDRIDASRDGGRVRPNRGEGVAASTTGAGEAAAEGTTDATRGTAAAADAATDATRATAETVHVAAEVGHTVQATRAGSLLDGFGHLLGKGAGLLSKVPGVRFIPIAGQVLMVGVAGATAWHIKELTERANEARLSPEEMAQVSSVNALAMAACADPTVVVSEGALYAARAALPAHLRQYCVESLGEMARPLDGGQEVPANTPATGADAPAATAQASAPARPQVNMQQVLLEQEARTAAAQLQAQQALMNATHMMTTRDTSTGLRFASVPTTSTNMGAAFVNHVPNDADPMRPDSVTGGMAPIGVVLGHL